MIVCKSQFSSLKPAVQSRVHVITEEPCVSSVPAAVQQGVIFSEQKEKTKKTESLIVILKTHTKRSDCVCVL